MISNSFKIKNSKLKIQDAKYPVMEAFYTIQGEGAYSGHASYFIRLAGCDVGCVWCDVKESWDASAHPVLPVEDIVKQAASYPARIAVITGGEPLMHDLNPLIDLLHENNFRVHIETSGSSPLQGKPDWICLSPKKFKAPLPELYSLADELKVIVFNKSDFKYAEEQAAKISPKCRLFLQPEWGKKDTMTPLIIDYVKAHPTWQISLQTHKYMDIP